MADILVVDDEIGIRELLSEVLGDEGHTVFVAENASVARRIRDQSALDLVLLDIWMPDTDGVTLLREWASNGKLTMPVIMMSGHATIETAVEATRIGAMDFLEKPITLQKLLRGVESGLARRNAMMHQRPSSLVSQPIPSQASSMVAPASVPMVGAYQAQVPSGMPMQAPPAAQPQMMHHAASLQAQMRPEPVREDPATVLTLAELPLEAPLREARDAFERAYFAFHLHREGGSMTKVAERTGLERTHLYRKLKQLGLDVGRNAYRRNNGG